MKNILYILIFLLTGFLYRLNAQEKIINLDLEEVIKQSQEQSIESIIARQVFQQSYWEYRTYKADMKPSLSMNLNPIVYERKINRDFNWTTGVYEYHETNINTSSTTLSLSQNIVPTGGILQLNSDLYGNFDIDNSSWDYSTSPYVSITQPLSGYNSFKWTRRIEPRKYEIAKRVYIQAMEDLALKAIDLFFDLSSAQVSLKIAEINHKDADTLYHISQGRYQIGKISENELLQMELNYLNSRTNLNDARINLSQAQFEIKSFLGYNEQVVIELTIPDTVPHIFVEMQKAVSEAKMNNPAILSNEKSLLESERNLAEIKAQKGINADMSLTYGLSRIDTLFPNIVTETNDYTRTQSINVGITIPIVDWGLNRGKYKMAQLNYEIARLQVEQAIIDFEQSVILQVLQFNMQEEQFEIAKKSEYVANKKYEVSKNRFLTGKIDVLDLNIAQKEKDTEKINYINSLRNYWKSIFYIRRITLYDFALDQSIYEKYQNKFEMELLQ